MASNKAPIPGAAAASRIKLTTNNAEEFWNHAWSANLTGWRGGEVSKPFTRTLYVCMNALGFPEAEGNVPIIPYEITEEMNTPELLNGPAEQAAVREMLAGKTVLVPLCGDTPVIAYLLEMGAATVIGADLSAQGLQSQREGNFPGVQFVSSEVTLGDGETATVFEGKSANGGKVVLFQGNFLKLHSCNAFTCMPADLVYDRASFMAMNPGLREDYARTIASVLKPTTFMVIERPVRAEGDTNGPPFMFPVDLPKQLYERFSSNTYDSVIALQDRWRVPPNPPAGNTLFFEFIALRPK